ncbi:MAG: hypothetical protein V7L20_06970 [Nostoc sp.]|uniref:hypothetical protein n=1 Tax=Nostoc sp. TaxID=1180 RepID=UPI002FF6022E
MLVPYPVRVSSPAPPVARDAESTANLLDYLVEEMELRYHQEFERHSSIETIAQYNLRFAPNFVMPRVICLMTSVLICFPMITTAIALRLP